jgi:hypothetical protein
MKPRVDEETAVRIRGILALCRSRGLDTVLALDQAGLLRYGAQMRADEIDFLERLIKSVRDVPADRLPRIRLTNTAVDHKNITIAVLEEVREGLARLAARDQKVN